MPMKMVPGKGRCVAASVRLWLAAAPVVVAGCFVGAAPEASAITIREDVAIKTINNRSNRPRYKSIGRFDTNATHRSLAGTGTLVAPQWVLTAAHVVDGANAQKFTVGNQTYNIAGWAAPPQYDTDPGFGYDLALVKLDRPVTGIDPADLYRTNSSELNRTGMILGYGYSGTGATGENNRTAQTLRISTNRIDGVQGGQILLTDFNAPDGSGNQLHTNEVTRFEGGLTPGDSGGPAFIYDGSNFTLGGVAVFASDVGDGILDGDYGEINGFVRVQPHISWIDSVITGNPTLRTAAATAVDVTKRGAGTLTLTSTSELGQIEGGTLSSIVTPLSGSDLPLDENGIYVIGQPVPEPATLAILGGLGLLSLRRRR